MTFRQALTFHLNSVMKKNITDFDSTIHPVSISLVLGNGKLIQSREEFIRFHEDWFADNDWCIEFEVINTRETEQMASALLYVHYDDFDEKGNPYQLNYYLHLLFENVNGKWLLVFDQNTNIR
ncbi:YybH family protein [Ornithinibacillus bavariensis]|uniref:SnoaL-like domain-containing protein n=1 Tax=Ornithinibacillus bavariensis TaxID=545502 RepID=A0A919X4M3_9BACI|nr:nuclear transport factor 2 family protein [Ornithinibacillus bavariensis]GIO25791.1 hypothetical protein J43TS3_04020 [Ornithinibacillus bavariensis]